MSLYIDGFAFPISTDRLEAYQQLAAAIAAIWIEHGALEYREHASDGTGHEATVSFTDRLHANEGETIVFGWIAFESRAARDRAHEQIGSDPRVAELMAASETGFDPARMAYGGFTPLVSA